MSTTGIDKHAYGVYVRRNSEAAVTQYRAVKATTGTAGNAEEWDGSGNFLGFAANLTNAADEELNIGIDGVVWAKVGGTPGTINDGTSLELDSNGEVIAAATNDKAVCVSQIGEHPAIGTTAAAGDVIPVRIDRHDAP